MKRKVIDGIAYDKVKGYQLRARCLGCSFTGSKRFSSHCYEIPVEVCNEKDQPIWVRSQVQPIPRLTDEILKENFLRSSYE